MKRRLSVREAIYKEDLSRAAKRPVSKKLELAIELSDFCRYLRSRALVSHRGKK